MEEMKKQSDKLNEKEAKEPIITKEKVKKGFKAYIKFRLFLWRIFVKPVAKVLAKLGLKVFESGLTGKDPWEL